MLKGKIELKLVTSNDHKFLYELLMEREPIENISHKKMPAYKEHIKFIRSGPYTKWYIINYDKQKAGSIYLSKQDEIGIDLKKEFSSTSIQKISMKILMNKNPRKRYLANTNYKNLKLKRFFTEQGFKLIQYTYELER